MSVSVDDYAAHEAHHETVSTCGLCQQMTMLVHLVALTDAYDGEVTLDSLELRDMIRTAHACDGGDPGWLPLFPRDVLTLVFDNAGVLLDLERIHLSYSVLHDTITLRCLGPPSSDVVVPLRRLSHLESADRELCKDVAPALTFAATLTNEALTALRAGNLDLALTRLSEVREFALQADTRAKAAQWNPRQHLAA